MHSALPLGSRYITHSTGVVNIGNKRPLGTGRDLLIDSAAIWGGSEGDLEDDWEDVEVNNGEAK